MNHNMGIKSPRNIDIFLVLQNRVTVDVLENKTLCIFLVVYFSGQYLSLAFG